MRLFLIAIIAVSCITGTLYAIHPKPLWCSFDWSPIQKAQAETNCNYYPQAHLYNSILQLYQHNPYGHIWALESGPLPYNSGSKVVPAGGGWFMNEGNLNNIRNEVATPHFAENRPMLGIGGNGPYDQNAWRYYGFMDRPNDWKNVEISGLYYACRDCAKSGSGPQSVDIVVRGASNSDIPYNCQATNYHIAYSYVGEDGGWKLERDLDHHNIEGYCNGCRVASQLPVAPDIPLVGLGKVFGFKVVVYNNIQNTKVRLDVYIDPSGTGSQWKLVWSYIDDGKDPLIDSVRGNIGCQGEDPTKPITWGGPAVSFRINASHVDYRQLTVQEIIPPKW